MPLDSRATQTTATNSATYLVNSRRRVFATGALAAACCGASALACCPAYSRLTSGSFAAIQYPPNGCDQTIKFDRFGIKLLAPRGNRLLAFAGKRMCGQSDDGKVLGLRVVFQTPRGFPAVNNGHFDVHQDNIRLLGRRYLAPFLAVLGRENLEIPKKLKPHFEHIDVVVVVFDIKHFDHDAAPLPLRTAGLLGHLAVISPEQIVTPRVAKSKLDWPPFELQGRTGSACDSWAHPTNALPPEGRQPPTVSLGRNHDFEGIECEVDHTSCVPNGNAV